VNQDINLSQFDQIQQNVQTEQTEFIFGPKDELSEQSLNDGLTQSPESQISLGFQNQQVKQSSEFLHQVKQPSGSFQQSGYESQTILGFLTNQVSCKGEL